MIGRRAQYLFWLVVIGMFLAGPLAVARMGAYMRYVGDDYCYSSALKSGGFVGGQINSFQMVERFNGDRYSLTLVSFATGLLGPRGYSAAVAVMLVLWLAGLFVAVYQLLRILGFEHALGPSLAIASVVTFFILLTNADLFAAVYWVSAYYSYFGAIVAIIWLTAAVLTLLRLNTVTWWNLLALFAFACVFGAFSEVGTVVQVVWLMLMTLAAWAIEGRRFWQRDYALFLAPLLGTTLALVTMMVSPYGKSFIFSGAPSIDVAVLAVRIIGSSGDYYLSPGRGFTTPFLVEMILLGALGFLLSRMPSPKVEVAWTRFALILLAIFVSGWLLVGVAFSPSYMLLDSSPSVRALTPSQAIRQLMYASLALAVGWFIGRTIAIRMRALSIAVVAAPLVILAASMYPIRAFPYLVEREPFMKKWALLWDQRDKQIREAALKGELQIQVMALDHPIPWVAELGEDPNAAYNVCAQEYYGIPTIIANLPGWDSFNPP